MKTFYTLTTPAMIRLTKRVILFFLIATIVFFRHANGQDTSKLTDLKGYPFIVLYSSGLKDKAGEAAARCDSAIRYMQTVLGFTPAITLYILSPKNWNQYSPNPYGVPSYEDQNLIVPGVDNPLWRSLIPPLETLPPETAKSIQKLFKTPDGNLSLEKYFDLIALHELGHSFAWQDSVKFPRRWLDELFANLFLHTYLAEKEPSLLPIVETPAEIGIGMPMSSLKYTNLQDFETYYFTMVKMDPMNYGWYQARFHRGAKRIYEDGGVAALKALWTTFLNNKNVYTDEELLVLLKSKDPAVAKLAAEW